MHQAKQTRAAIKQMVPDRPTTEEQLLIQKAQQGDRRAFAVLVDRYWDRLYRWLYHVSHRADVADDLTQETFLKALAGLSRFRSGTNFHAWLFRIGHNCFIDQQRSVARARQSLPDQLASSERGPEANLVSDETRRLLIRAVGRLPRDFRAAFVLRAEQGLSFREIADVLGTTEETARWRVFKARQKLMRILAPQLDGEMP